MPLADATAYTDLICLSHLRWNFVFQRPQHLMTRCVRERRVFYVEEPIFESGTVERVELRLEGQITVVVPHLPLTFPDEQVIAAQRSMLDRLIASYGIDDYMLWYYTPMALPFTEHLRPRTVVYDCMDELSAFKNAPPALKNFEQRLLQRATVVFVGGQSLFEAKRHQHHYIHPFPSSVDVAHFAQAREIIHDPADQAPIPRPRLGYFGVIDERIDMELIDGVASSRPDWQIVMVGPVVKIDSSSLPCRPNIHYLGSKQYAELPHYVAGWDVALLPFARNDATRFISPTKTPEYMAAGKPVVSTTIRDVVRPYGQLGLVHIADDAPAFVKACAEAMSEDCHERITQSDAFLRHTSWDGTWTRMRQILESLLPAGDVEEHSRGHRDVAAPSNG